jgi:hypothetical protein
MPTESTRRIWHVGAFTVVERTSVASRDEPRPPTPPGQDAAARTERSYEIHVPGGGEITVARRLRYGGLGPATVNWYTQSPSPPVAEAAVFVEAMALALTLARALDADQPLPLGEEG